MNDVVKAILERRSVRSFKPDGIPDADLDLIVQSGLYAPSAKNAQAWHILVVRNAGKIDLITAEVKAAILRAKVEKYAALAENPKYSVNFGSAPVFMIVSADPGATSCPAEDCSCLLENMFLAAHSLGIGSCWINQLGCVTDEPRFRETLTSLGVPAVNRVYGSAAFGYPARAPHAAPPRRENTVAVIT